MTTHATRKPCARAQRWPRTAMLAAATALAAAAHEDARAGAQARNAPARTPQSQLIVGNCDDSGPGSLRDTIASAASGDMIDLSELACSTITLTSGAIEIPQDGLYIKYSGEGGTPPTIEANLSSRVFHHTGYGELKLTGLTIRQGKYDNTSASSSVSASGGCIYSRGSVYLVGSTVTGCVAKDTRGEGAAGGGIYAWQDLTLLYSVVSGNTANSTLRFSDGGGMFTHGAVDIAYSSISGNTASGDGYGGSGGGLAMINFGSAASTISHSTIDGNLANRDGGLMSSGGGSDGAAITIADSTISGNTANVEDGGAYLRGPVTLASSTIAFNTGYRGVLLGSPAFAVEFESSILADNGSSDLGALADVTITGANNLVMAAGAGVVLPADTTAADPMLAPLADNGGPTRTHALAPASPAIDTGNDIAALANDQRGPGHPRVAGAAADIGAFESGISVDTIFADGFDGGARRFSGAFP